MFAISAKAKGWETFQAGYIVTAAWIGVFVPSYPR